MTRRESREQAFILIFEKIFNPDATFDEIAASAELSGSHKPDEFAMNLARKAYDSIDETDAIIAKNARGWRPERLSRMALAILRLAICEMRYYDDIPTSVSINEAVELAKNYGAEEDASFINGLLGTFAREGGAD